ncbi:ATP-binding protein [Ignatzschineria rhizosphaerae]|uniref:ATP-binding protein n=1 Tax=Ignatzschineria rhizosphaerae TaxID=2923279 RepID=A0ABY3X7D3_9GAMM|nr:ATP-binding protein [Ignatzschineria rhizosphaerae]UNM96660.1 ATP-binding protein [Ignatzschineria rhizosphaerae]
MINIYKNIGKGQVNLLCYQVDKNNLDGSPMKIQEIEIADIGGIRYLKLENLDPHMNIICGENGVGKTTMLDAISFIFSGAPSILKRRSGSDKGVVKLKNTTHDNIS